MNVHGLMEDLLSSIQSQPEKARENYFDSSLALACNLITNTIAGDLSDQNLIAFLDQEFLQILLRKRFERCSVGYDIPLLLQGLHSLRTNSSSEVSGTIISQCLLDFYRGAFPLGTWDDLLTDGDTRDLTAQNLVARLRPDLASIVFDEPKRMAWLIKHGFQELPLYRSKIRHYFSDALGGKNFQLQAGDIGFSFHQISSSMPPQDKDLFIHSMEFKRWICVKGAMLIYKKRAFEARIHDLRWLQKNTTLAVKSSSLGALGRLTVSLGTLGDLCDFSITVHSAAEKQEVVFFKNVSAVLCEFRLQKWVDIVRITIEASGNYSADLGIS